MKIVKLSAFIVLLLIAFSSCTVSLENEIDYGENEANNVPIINNNEKENPDETNNKTLSDPKDYILKDIQVYENLYSNREKQIHDFIAQKSEGLNEIIDLESKPYLIAQNTKYKIMYNSLGHFEIYNAESGEKYEFTDLNQKLYPTIELYYKNNEKDKEQSGKIGGEIIEAMEDCIYFDAVENKAHRNIRIFEKENGVKLFLANCYSINYAVPKILLEDMFNYIVYANSDSDLDDLYFAYQKYENYDEYIESREAMGFGSFKIPEKTAFYLNMPISSVQQYLLGKKLSTLSYTTMQWRYHDLGFGYDVRNDNMISYSDLMAVVDIDFVDDKIVITLNDNAFYLKDSFYSSYFNSNYKEYFSKLDFVEVVDNLSVE